MAAGIDPPHRIAVHGFLLVGGEKMSKSALNQIAPADLTPTFGVDGFRYHFLRDQAFGPDGDFSYEGMVARYNADLANNLGNLLARVSTVVERKCGGIGPGPDPDSPLAAVAASVYEAAAAAWDRIAPSEALEATWRLVRETNAALEAAEPWKAEPGPAVDAVLGDALEVLRIVAILASPALTRASQEIWRRIGLPGRVEDQRLPEAAAWGGYPGGLPVERGTAAFPPDHGLAAMWADSHCHIAYDGVEPVGDRGGPGGRRDPDDHHRDRRRQSRRPPSRSPGPTQGSGRRSACIPTRRPRGRGDRGSPGASPTRWSWASANAVSTIYYDHSPRAAQRQAFAAQIGLAAELDLALVVHTRDAWDDTFEILAAEGVPDRWVLHCFQRRPGRGGPGAGARGVSCRSAG